MELIATIMQWITIVLMVVIAPIAIWQMVIAVMGLLPMKKRPRLEERNYRFAVIACARNEEAVIGNLIDSLAAQDYPKDSYRIFIVADNCTDNTAGEARAHGATVYERFNRQQVGKGFALSWALHNIDKDYPEMFDAFCVFDADNLAEPDFLTKTNIALCSGADVTQGYRDTKNPFDSGVSGSYAVYWMMLTRFYHRARYNIGLSCMVGGTGFAFKKAALGPNGWETHTLVEDCEFSIQQVCAGHKIVPVYDAVFYDEQPATFAVSVRQRFRWLAGTIQCSKYCLPRVLRSVCKGNWRALDMIAYMWAIPIMGLMALASLTGLLAMALNPETALYAVWFMISSGVWSLLSLNLLALLTVLVEKKPVRQYAKAILAYPIFLIPMTYMALAAIVHPRIEWKPIVHTKSKSIADMADLH